jgi:hypothetical protein
MSEKIYDPLEFIQKVEIITMALLGSFVTMKFLNAVYDNLYEPTIDVVINSGSSEKYYLKLGTYYIHVGTIFKEFIKWLILIIFLMIIYNIIMRDNAE